MTEGKSVDQGIRRHHRRLVMDVLRRGGPRSKADLVEQTGLSGNTVAGLLTELRQQGIVTKAPPLSGSRSKGRPPDQASLNPALAVLGAIEFGSGLIRVAVSDLGRDILARRERSLPPGDDPQTALDVAASMVHEALVEARMPKARLLGVGVALPAPVDRTNDRLHSTNFPGPGWALPDFHPAQELRERLGVPIETDNDANLAALAELVGGVANNCSHFIYVKAAAGIGCGLVLDGRLYRGADGAAGELAHVVVDPHGELCYCGNWGCLWTVVGAAAVARTLSLARPSEAVPRYPQDSQRYYEQLVREVIGKARSGDLPCQRALQDAGRQLGRAAATVCTILNPRMVVVGGTLSTSQDFVLTPMQEALREYRPRFSSNVVRVVPGLLGKYAELYGALALVLHSEAFDVLDRLDLMSVSPI